MLDDIVSELWRKENVTSGYCPRYRYTLIAMLTLDNLYYICVDFLPTHISSWPSIYSSKKRCRSHLLFYCGKHCFMIGHLLLKEEMLDHIYFATMGMDLCSWLNIYTSKERCGTHLL
jgi:hypothetical protein